MVVRIVPQAFVSDGFLIGPGRHDFGSAVHSWSVDGQTLPDDPSLDLPASYVQVITPEMGVAGALNRLAAKIGHVGSPPITLKSLGYSGYGAVVLELVTGPPVEGAADSVNRVQIHRNCGRAGAIPLAGPCRAVCLSRRTERPLGVRLVDGSLGCPRTHNQFHPVRLVPAGDQQRASIR